MQKELTVVKVNGINEETFDAVTRNLRNKLCYGGPHNMRHILVHYLQKEPLCALYRSSFDRGDHRWKNRVQFM